MKSKIKQLLVGVLAVAVISSNFVAALIPNAATITGTIAVTENKTVVASTTDTTVDVPVKVTFTEAVTGPHGRFSITADGATLTNVKVDSFDNANAEENPDAYVRIGDEYGDDGTNLETGTILVESAIDNKAAVVTYINLVATFTVPANTAAGTVIPVTVKGIDTTNANEDNWEDLVAANGKITVHGAGTTYGYNETNHWLACAVSGCTEHKYNETAHTMSDYVANEDGTTETATCTANCGYSVTRNVVVDEEPEYDVKFGTTRAVRVIEPWAIRFRARARDNAVSGNPTISLSEFSDYGYYILPEIKVPDGVTVDQQYIIENGKHFDSSLCTKDGDYFVALYEDDLYTYMMGSNIYYIDYVVSNGVTVYSPDYYTTTLSTVIESRLGTLNDKVSPTDLEVIEINLLNCMNTMYEKVVAHRGSEYTPVEENIIPRVSDTQFADVVENSGYYFGTTRAVKVIEPWAIRFRNRIRNVSDGSTVALSSFVDYGFILLKSGDTLAETVDVNEMLTNQAGYVFSKSNGYATKDGDTEYFIGLFDDSIYTYQMSETYYYLRYYVTENGMVVDTAGVQQTSFETVINSRLSSISTAVEGDDTFTEKEVLESMLSLYTYVTAYRQ